MHNDKHSPVALVTGAAQGIGRGIARRLLAEGYHVWALDQDQPALDDLAQSLDTAGGPRLVTRAVDVGDENPVRSALTAIKTEDGRLDLLVNNAGIANPFSGPVEELALTDWERVLRVNLTGYFLLTKHATALLRATGGCIVNVASSRAIQSEPNSEAYAASKGGIEALTHALAISLGPAIRVNAVAPGWIDVRAKQNDAPAQPKPLRDVDHDQQPTGHVGRADDIAGIVAFLAGPDAAFITGQTLVADGGMTRKMIYRH